MTKSPIALQLPTSMLKIILEENPELLLTLQNMACEKIAEEIVRKIGKIDLEKQAKEALSLEISDVIRSYQASFRLPKEAIKAIDEGIKDRHSDFFKEHRNDFSRDLDQALAVAEKKLAMKIDASVEHFSQRFNQQIREIARKEFMSVIAEVKATTGAF